MLLYFSEIFRAKSLGGLPFQESAQKRLHLNRQEAGEFKLPFLDVLEHHFHIVVIERRLTYDHLMQDSPNTVDV